MLSEEIRYKILKILENNPSIKQREIATLLGVSLGKTNYCIQALIDKGLLKARNFKNNSNKMAYTYLLTPGGLEEKTRLTVQFLRKKIQEYEDLKNEISELQSDVLKNSGKNSSDRNLPGV